MNNVHNIIVIFCSIFSGHLFLVSHIPLHIVDRFKLAVGDCINITNISRLDIIISEYCINCIIIYYKIRIIIVYIL